MRGVSQISPPIRILVVAAVALMAAWMLVLKPKPETVAPPAPAPNVDTGAPAVSKPGQVAQAAKQAAAASEAKTSATDVASGGAAAQSSSATESPAATAPAGPAAEVVGKVKGLPKPVAKAIDQRDVLVLLFWNSKSADDRAVRRQLRKVDRWNGGVTVHVAPVGKVSRYARITRGADVAQSPTTLVIDRELKVTPLVGYVDTETVDQAVLDALRDSGGFLKDPYLAKVNNLCATAGRVSFSVAQPNNAAQVPGYVASQKRIFQRLNTRFAALKAPARMRGFKRATVRDHRAIVAFFGDWAAYLGSKPSNARVLSSITQFGPRARTISKGYNKRMDQRHVLSCGSNA
jgi:hypothetical protein